MWPRLAIVVGLLAGVAVAGLAIGGILFLGPGPVQPPLATPTAVTSPSPSPSPVPSPSPSAVAPSPSPSPSSAAPSPSGSPALVVPKVGGGTILDGALGALGGIGPDIMARGLGTILPDVKVEP